MIIEECKYFFSLLSKKIESTTELSEVKYAIDCFPPNVLAHFRHNPADDGTIKFLRETLFKKIIELPSPSEEYKIQLFSIIAEEFMMNISEFTFKMSEAVQKKCIDTAKILITYRPCLQELNYYSLSKELLLRELSKNGDILKLVKEALDKESASPSSTHDAYGSLAPSTSDTTLLYTFPSKGFIVTDHYTFYDPRFIGYVLVSYIDPPFYYSPFSPTSHLPETEIPADDLLNDPTLSLYDDWPG